MPASTARAEAATNAYVARLAGSTRRPETGRVIVSLSREVYRLEGVRGPELDGLVRVSLLEADRDLVGPECVALVVRDGVDVRTVRAGIALLEQRHAAVTAAHRAAIARAALAWTGQAS